MQSNRNFALTALIAATFIVSATPVSAFAPGDTAPAPAANAKPEGGHTRGVSVLVTALDTNKDGALSAEEIANASKSLLQLDRDSDGKITGPEFHPTLRPMSSPSADISARFLEFDKNGDGKLEKSEVPERMQPLFAKADANNDGSVDKAELTAFVEKMEKEKSQQTEASSRRTAQEPGSRPRRRPAGTGEPAGGVQTHGKDTFVSLGGKMDLTRRLSRLLVALDTDKDLTLSAAEIANAPAALKALDTNGDGQISAEELSAAGKTEFVSPEVKATLKADAK